MKTSTCKTTRATRVSVLVGARAAWQLVSRIGLNQLRAALDSLRSKPMGFFILGRTLRPLQREPGQLTVRKEI
jgi:hypothetical protein